MLLLGEGAVGQAAVDLGLAYKCVVGDELAAESSALAQKLAQGPTRAFGLTKRLLNASFETDLAHSLELEGHFQGLATTTSDLREE
jgi:2-(1,2-epoxy-1,2-dihydrophenyl)acetyl-CoA isomerase